MSIGIMILVLIVLMLMRVPVALSLIVSSALYLITHQISLVALIQELGTGINAFALLAAPFFILVGNLMNRGGITERLFGFVKTVVGHIRGALGHANILVSMLFAGISGAAFADAAGLGTVEIKAMEEDGYDKDFAVAVTGASSSVGPIIPPSIIMVVIGVTAGTSIGKLFLGGIIPGIIMGLAMIIFVGITAVRRNYPKGEKPTVRLIAKSFIKAFPALLTPLIIIGGILGGIFTPTEAGAVAVIYAFILSVFVHKEVSIKEMPKILLQTMLTTGKILFIVAASAAFGWIMAYEQVPQKLSHAVLSTITNPTSFLMISMLIFLVLGCFMEASSIVVMTVPVLLPTLMALNIDLTHFGVLLAISMSIGTLTPPLGLVMYILMEISGLPIEKYTKAIAPYLLLLIFVLVLMIFIPKVVLWIPGILIN